VTEPRVIFVFGSNLAGQHWGGAALGASLHWGARQGVGEGFSGESYALPTMDARLVPLGLIAIQAHILTFLEVAAARPDWTFFVTAVATGIAGYTAREIAPLFAGASKNVQLPCGWRALAGGAK
jgi:hypothetical protein